MAEVAAAPPLVAHPVMAALGEPGKLFVGDAPGLNLNEAELEQQLPNRVVLLHDTDGDGIYEKATVFADKMTFPQGGVWLVAKAKLGKGTVAPARDDLRGTQCGGVARADPDRAPGEGGGDREGLRDRAEGCARARNGAAVSLVGVIRRNLPESIVIADPAGQEHALPRAGIISMQALPTSLMPNGLDHTISEAELLDLVAFLHSRK